MAFIDEDDINFEEEEVKEMKSANLLSFRYGTSIMPSSVKGITAKPGLQIIDPRKFDEEAKMNFAENLSTSRRKGKNLELQGKYPSVSALLGAAEEDLTKLYDWQKKKVLELEYDGFRKYMTQRTSSGTNFHKSVEILLAELQKSGSISDEACEKAFEKARECGNHEYIKSIIPFLKDLRKTEWMKLEKRTTNHYYCYQGRFDAIIELNGEPTLVDWKSVSSDAYKHNTTEKANDLKRLYGVPLQVCAYIAAVNTDPDYQTMPKIRQGAVVLAYQDGRPAEPVIIKPDDLKEYYQILAEKINSFWWKMLHPKKEDKDINGNINFVFNPNLNPRPPKIDTKPDVIVLDDEVIIETSEDQKPKEEESKPKVYAMFESKNNNAAAAEEKDSTKKGNQASKNAVFGV